MPNTPHPDPGTLWKNRRRLAYMSFIALVGLGIVAWKMPPEQLEAASTLLVTLAWVWGLIIGAYVGAATMEDIAKIRTGQPQSRRSYSRWDERDI
jgi:hypothetical protein